MFNLMTDFHVMVILAHGHIRVIALGPSVRSKSVLLCRFDSLHSRQAIGSSENKTPKVVSVECVGLWKHNGVQSEFGKIRETGKMCHVMSIDE